MSAAFVPEDARSLAEVLAVSLGVPGGGRLELIYDHDLRCVDAYVKPRSERRTPKQLAGTSIYCSCLINTSLVDDRCCVCGRPKRPQL